MALFLNSCFVKYLQTLCLSTDAKPLQFLTVVHHREIPEIRQTRFAVFLFRHFPPALAPAHLFFSETKNTIDSVSPSRHCDSLIMDSCLALTTTLSLRIKRVNL